MPRTERPSPAGRLYRIPVFGLYGAAAGQASGGYVHIETISSRAPAHDWEILVHRHENLAQCVLVQEGGGTLEVEGEKVDFTAPWFVWMPSAAVHGFRFDTGTEGHVLTVSDDVVAGSIAGVPEGERLAQLLLRPVLGAARGEEEIAISMPATMRAIAREHDLPRTGVTAALQAHLVLLLVAILRTRTLSELAETLGNQGATGFRRFREHVERNFRRQESIDEIASQLGMSRGQLYAVTMRAVGKSPLRILHDRRIIECKRELTYSTQPIAQIAYELGFSDEAYFSRFFTKHAGMSPSAFRKARRKALGAD
ncbi:helix-turn-helix domain-containing protein [Roseococcus thiosulfatophilus]|uniref:helix-turn-helix domain-containing protein n=1 Tax=Roseococcus thiosulfatophilus TaxID=35813 RepID=UPI001A8CF217|nr:helix-turn-helix domain-containing protein [Roseococcus thiosulfatophilus]